MRQSNQIRSIILFVAVSVFCGTVSTQIHAKARVETVQFHSQLINSTLPYSVVLPIDYDSSRVSRYPVLYLLHGLTGHYSDWLSRTNLGDYASQYRLIVVTPESNAGLMLDKKIPHEYRQLPGDHSWGYWDRQIQEVLRVGAKFLGVRRVNAAAMRNKAVTSHRTPKRFAIA